MLISDFIPYGKENAVSKKFILAMAKRAGLIKSKDGEREVRRLISEARFDGNPILYSKKGGYYRPTEKEIMELREYIERETGRAKTILASLDSAKGLYTDLCNGAITRVER